MIKMSASQAMRAIKDKRCCECGRQAKGLVYRQQSINYYCKKCLHDYMEQKEVQEKEAATGSA